MATTRAFFPFSLHLFSPLNIHVSRNKSIIQESSFMPLKSVINQLSLSSEIPLPETWKYNGERAAILLCWCRKYKDRDSLCRHLKTNILLTSLGWRKEMVSWDNKFLAARGWEARQAGNVWLCPVLMCLSSTTASFRQASKQLPQHAPRDCTRRREILSEILSN